MSSDNSKHSTTTPQAYFLSLAETTKGNAGALISQAISSPRLFHFSELLHHPNISNSNSGNNLDLLELFAYGTVAQYENNRTKYGLLNTSQLFKLRQLTLVSLVCRASKKKRRNIPYDTILQELGMDKSSEVNMRELENLIITSVYSGIIEGKMDHKNMYMVAHGAISRDIKVADLSGMIDQLEAFEEKNNVVLRHLSNCAENVQLNHEDDMKKWQKVEMAICEVRNRDGVAGRDMSNPLAGLTSLGAGSIVVEATASALVQERVAGYQQIDRKSKRSRGGVAGSMYAKRGD